MISFSSSLFCSDDKFIHEEKISEKSETSLHDKGIGSMLFGGSIVGFSFLTASPGPIIVGLIIGAGGSAVVHHDDPLYFAQLADATTLAIKNTATSLVSRNDVIIIGSEIENRKVACNQIKEAFSKSVMNDKSHNLINIATTINCDEDQNNLDIDTHEKNGLTVAIIGKQIYMFHDGILVDDDGIDINTAVAPVVITAVSAFLEKISVNKVQMYRRNSYGDLGEKKKIPFSMWKIINDTVGQSMKLFSSTSSK